MICIFFACNNNPQQESKQTSASPTEEQQTTRPKPAIIFFGNSLSAGYGISPDSAFPALIQNRLDSLGYQYQVVNAGVSGETTATGKSRVGWVVSRQPVEIFVLELGGNDGLRGIPVEETRKNLEAIIDSVRATHANAKIVLAGMMVPPNMGPDYSREFTAIYPAVAKAKQVALIPFLLEKVGGEPELNLPDGIHPTAEGHALVAENVWAVLKDIVQQTE